MSRSARLDDLRRELRAIETPGPLEAALTFGSDAIDGALPAGGLPCGVHEFCPATGDLPDEAAATCLLAHLLGGAEGPVVWVLSRRFLFAPGLEEAGLSHRRLIYAEAGDERDVLAVTEEALRHGSLAGVVAETTRLSLLASRRLQLASQEGRTPCLMLRRWRRGEAPLGGSAAMTRWQVGTRPSSGPYGLPRPSWRLALERCRGGRPGCWNVEVDGMQDAGSRSRLLATSVSGAAPADTALPA